MSCFSSEHVMSMVRNFLSVVVLLALSACNQPSSSNPPQAQPQTPQAPAAQADADSSAVDPVDYFWAGFFSQTFTDVNYATHEPSMAAWLKYLQQGRDTFVKAGATPEVLDSFDQAGDTFSSLPLQLPSSQWTPEQCKRAAGVQLDNAAVNAWLGPVDTPGPFFYWLGSHVSFLTATAPSEIMQWGETIDQIQPSFKTLLYDFPVFRDKFPDVMAKLTPDARAAVETLAAKSQAIIAAKQGVSEDDLDVMKKQAKIILEVAADGKLTQ
ncbi:MAG TPA: hypothetical protein VGC39_10775 [Candidatus Methylacidiphilales bacterium]